MPPADDADGDTEVDPAEDPDEGDAPASDGEPPRRRRALDGRTVAICALVALIAALVAGFITAQVTGDDDEPSASEAELETAVEVPDVALQRFDGTEVSPADFRGQPMVMNFWASWCVPCTEEMPAFQQVHESLGEDVAFLGVNVRDTVETAEAMVESTGVTYELGRDTTGDLSRDLDVVTLPVTVIVDPSGTILETFHGEMSAARLCEALNQTVMNQSLGEGDCG